jgi:hypothetical protein
MSLELYAGRVRDHFDGDPRIAEKKAFGGIMFLLNGNMLVAVQKDGGLLVHVARDDVEAGLAREGATQMVHGGRTMTGFLWVAPYATEEDEQLADWLMFAAASTAKLPPKSKADKPAPRKRKARAT